MLRLSRLTDYGLALMSSLAAAPAGSVHASRGVAAATGLPLATVSKLLKQLQRAGLLASQRGLRGGYTLARPAAAISLAEVVAALEGPIALTECQTADPAGCDRAGACPVQGTWRVVNRTLVQALAGVSLATVARPALRRRGRQERVAAAARSPRSAGVAAEVKTS